MASKAAARVRKKEVVKVLHGTLLKTNIKSQMASAAPPLGPQLGQRGINVANFCKEFNKETGHIKPGETAGKLSVKHIYEIALIKQRDKALHGVPLEQICKNIVKTSRTIGIEVQLEDLDPQHLKEFLDSRRDTVAAQLKDLQEKKAAKMLRTS